MLALKRRHIKTSSVILFWIQPLHWSLSAASCSSWDSLDVLALWGKISAYWNLYVELLNDISTGLLKLSHCFLFLFITKRLWMFQKAPRLLTLPPLGRSLTTGHEGPSYHPHQNSDEMFWLICHLRHCFDTFKKMVNNGQIHAFPVPSAICTAGHVSRGHNWEDS